MTEKNFDRAKEIKEQIGNAKTLLLGITGQRYLNLSDSCRYCHVPEEIEGDMVAIVKKYIEKLEKEFAEL